MDPVAVETAVLARSAVETAHLVGYLKAAVAVAGIAVVVVALAFLSARLEPKLVGPRASLVSAASVYYLPAHRHFVWGGLRLSWRQSPLPPFCHLLWLYPWTARPLPPVLEVVNL